jgi:hypothetical protein
VIWICFFEIFLLDLRSKKKKGKLMTNKIIETADFLVENGFNIQDNICVFCSRTFDRWDSICVSCREYKGVMNIIDAVEYYGVEILPL